MDHFENFNGFAIQTDMAYETFHRESPIDTACRILQDYKGKFVEIGCDVVTADRPVVVNLTVPDDNTGIEEIFKEIVTDYIFIDFPEDPIKMYAIQKLVVGNQAISQVERRI